MELPLHFLQLQRVSMWPHKLQVGALDRAFCINGPLHAEQSAEVRQVSQTIRGEYPSRETKTKTGPFASAVFIPCITVDGMRDPLAAGLIFAPASSSALRTFGDSLLS
jgi:hypothetical protein